MGDGDLWNPTHALNHPIKQKSLDGGPGAAHEWSVRTRMMGGASAILFLF